MFSACSVQETKENIYIKRLCRHSWQVSTFVNNSINEVVDVPLVNYKFETNGILTKTYENGETHTANWYFSDNLEYLNMGNNTFRIRTLSSKVLAVSYGEVEIFFVPVN